MRIEECKINGWERNQEKSSACVVYISHDYSGGSVQIVKEDKVASCYQHVDYPTVA